MRDEIDLPSQNQSLSAGDGAAISEETTLELFAKSEAELRLLDLA